MTSLCYEARYLDEVAGDVPAGDVQPAGQVRQAEAFVHRTDVSHPVARVHHHAGPVEEGSKGQADGHRKPGGIVKSVDERTVCFETPLPSMPKKTILLLQNNSPCISTWKHLQQLELVLAPFHSRHAEGRPGGVDRVGGRRETSKGPAGGGHFFNGGFIPRALAFTKARPPPPMWSPSQ
ncbi:hypothetical protein EYF80_049428 [Liparis tanakae]|uniref:Uncharacterized protein n=1 Tax=Liparis tanakae TaxID=230148 RepID=A0A4Z2FI23_9TELE|nr:hypothetical protein EYF80_049428 [Liparis tanakae]